MGRSIRVGENACACGKGGEDEAGEKMGGSGFFRPGLRWGVWMTCTEKAGNYPGMDHLLCFENDVHMLCMGVCVHKHMGKHILRSGPKILSVYSSVYYAADHVSLNALHSALLNLLALSSRESHEQLSPSDRQSVMLKIVDLRGCLLHYKAAVLCQILG